MHNILLIFGMLVFLLGGVMIVGGAAIYGWICMTASAVLVTGFGIVNALVEIQKILVAERDGKFKMNARTHRLCPVCREVVRIDAHRCRYCTSQITPPPEEPAPPAPTPDPDIIPAPRQVKPPRPADNGNWST